MSDVVCRSGQKMSLRNVKSNFSSRLGVVAMTFLTLVSSGCGMNKATQGALAGATLGAGTGAIVGSQTGRAGPGIAIGAAVGALGGALVGNGLDNADEQNRQLEGRSTENQRQIEENERIIQELRKRGADVRKTNRGVVVNLPDILFEFNRADLTRSAQSNVRDVADVLNKINDRRISVEGHTDDIGTMEYNKRLSFRRAETVAQALERSGVPRNQMRVQGYGEGAPIATNNTDLGRARNRRVEIVVENR